MQPISIHLNLYIFKRFFVYIFISVFMSFMCKSYSVVVVVESKSAVMRSAEAKSYSVVVIEVVNVLATQKKLVKSSGVTQLITGQLSLVCNYYYWETFGFTKNSWIQHTFWNLNAVLIYIHTKRQQRNSIAMAKMSAYNIENELFSFLSMILKICLFSKPEMFP